MYQQIFDKIINLSLAIFSGWMVLIIAIILIRQSDWLGLEMVKK